MDQPPIPHRNPGSHLQPALRGHSGGPVGDTDTERMQRVAHGLRRQLGTEAPEVDEEQR